MKRWNPSIRGDGARQASAPSSCVRPARQTLQVTADAVACAARSVNAVIAAPPGRRSVRAFRQRPFVYGAMAAYAVASIGFMASRQVGLTSEHVIVLGLVVFAVVARARPFVWDWLPFVFVAVMFEDLTSVGAKIAGGVHDVAPILFERSVFGGAIAATWLQDHVGTGVVARWFGISLAAEYLFHFAAPLVAGLWLWLRHRDHFGGFVGAYVLVMGLGFLTYLIYPEMPPWLAAQRGLQHLQPIHRIVVDTLQQVRGFGTFYSGADPEPNAAMPSLHVSVPLIIACSIVAVKGWWRWRSWLWMLYPATVSFGVIYLGEHYVSDVVVGLALGAVSFVVAERIQGRRQAAPAPLAVGNHPRHG